MKKTFLTLLLLVSFPLVASHIVGGEFELVHISENTYRLNLILYFDVLNGSPGAQDQSVTARIFRKSDHAIMGQITLPFLKAEEVNYTQPECSNGEIVTRKLYYTNTLTLSPSTYNDPQGYYIGWERCCRNYTISNIYSDPPGGSRFAGQTFYLEFPPVVKKGEPFINNSPRLFPPLNDYACPFRPYYVDFGGIDDDGDSLVYSLVSPLNTFTADALPPPDNLPRPGPYNSILWKPGFGINNIINGAPDLKISQDGFLTVTPTTLGLYVFAVKCEEFRNGDKIGEVRRDFQMLVVDGCPQAEPPQIVGKKLTDVSFSYNKTMSVSFNNSVTDADRCIQVRVSDPDASKIVDNFTEKISIRAVSLNFKKNVKEILPSVTSAILTNGSTQDFTICFPQCPFIEGGPYQIGIIAYDDACSLPLSDTLKIEVNIQPPANSKPYFVKPIDPITPVIVNEGGYYESDFEIRDDDNDEIMVSITNSLFDLASAGFTVQIDEPRVNGLVTGKIRWDAFCDIFDFTKRTYFEINILANDDDTCDSGEPVTASYKFNVILPGNADPIIDTDLTPDPKERRVLNLERKIHESLTFSVFGEDHLDNDFLELDSKQRSTFDGLGISFPKASGQGEVSSLFQWNLTCSTVNLKNQNNFSFQFMVIDNSNKCRVYKADTVDVQVKILPPENVAPQLIIQNGSSIVNEQTLTYTLGQPIFLNLIGTDADVLPNKDLIKLTLIEASGNHVQPEGYSFLPKEGVGKIESVFSWNPDCSIFTSDIRENGYTFKFKIGDDRCFNAKSDTVTVNIIVKDVDSDDTDFLPPNVFTPNGDGCNDYFALEGIDPCPFNPDQSVDPDDIVSLPPDNCYRKFESVRIYNRWGNPVFQSSERKFRWYAPDQAAGVYYYFIKYSDKEYKGSVSLRF